MKATTFVSLETFKNARFWLLGIASGLIAMHLTLTSRTEDASLWGVSALFWIAVASLIWTRRHTLSLESGILSSLGGILLIALVLVKSAVISGYDPFLRIFPLIAALGVALLASGFPGLKQYWRELLILFFIAPSPGALSLLIDLSPVTARFATGILWYLGFEVSRQGVYVAVPTGVVEVYSGCSGIELMLQLLGLAIVFLVMFPINRSGKVLAPVIAVCLAFLVNGVRVALLAVLSAPSNQKAFEYWHKGDGSLIFSMIAVLIFGLFCLFLLRQSEPEDSDIVES